MVPHYFCFCINEWIEVDEQIYAGWWGPKLILETNMDNAGWTIERQRKTYGPYVEITLNGRLEIRLTDNPMGLSIAAVQKQLDHIPPTRANADKVGFQLAGLFESIEAIATVRADSNIPIEEVDPEQEATILTPAFRLDSCGFPRKYERPA